MKGSCDSCQAQENAPTSVRDFTGPQDIGGLPEHIEAELKPSSKATCVASNRWGTMLAVGCEDGTTAVYDMITRGEACVYPPSSAEDIAEVTAVAFYRYGSCLVTGHANGLVITRDICQNVETASRRYSQAISRLSLSECPEPTLCVSLASGSPHVIAPDGTSKALQVPGPGPVTAIIERKEKFILVAVHSGAVLIVDPKSFGALDAIQDNPFRHVAFSSKCGSFAVVAGSSVRHWTLQSPTPQHYTDTQSLQAAVPALQAGAATVPAAGPLISRRCTECKDHVDAFKWTCADVSRDGEYICAAAVAADKHIIYVWQAAGGHIASVLEGPEGGLDWCGWHPDPGRLILLSRTDRGTVMVWARLMSQQWDVYAPGFRSLRQNEEYVESETEFDMNPKEVEEKVQELDLTCKVDFTSIREDEQFLFDSDTEADFQKAVIAPPLDLKAMATDGKAPVDKPAPVAKQAAPANAAATPGQGSAPGAEKKAAAAAAHTGGVVGAVDGAEPAAAAATQGPQQQQQQQQADVAKTAAPGGAQDVVMQGREGPVSDLDQPSKRLKLDSNV